MIPTDDVDRVSDTAQNDSAFTAHFARVVSTVAIPHVYSIIS